MKRLIVGAAGLLLSTSALAGVYVTKSDGAAPAAAETSLQPKTAIGLDDSMIDNAMLIDWTSKNAVAAEPASLDIKAMDEPKLIQAQVAEPPPEPSAETMAIEAEANVIEEPVAPADPMAAYDDGVGGPIETADASAATLDLSPQPAAQNYPPCAPGPGDDRCIQLYEPGVETALASWSGATGGLDNGQTGMGGPLESADASAATDLSPQSAAQGYPACAPGPGDDRCIQLYEPGVSEQVAMGGPEEVIDQSSAIMASDEEAAYEPLPEDVVMPADEEVALTDSPTSGSTMAL